MGAFAKNVMKLGSGNLIAQLISFAAVPVITRIYSPDEFGVFSIYFSVTMILFPVSTLRFNNALMLPENRHEAVNLLGLSVLASVLFSLVVALMIAVALRFFGGVGGMQASYLWLIPLGVMIQGIGQALVFWALRNKKFGAVAFSAVSESVTDRGIALAAGFMTNAGALGLIAGRMVGPFVSMWLLAHKTIVADFSELRRALSFSEMRRLAIRYRQFPLFSTWAFLFNGAAREMPTLLLTFFFSPVVTGLYALGMRVMNLPMMMIGDAVAKVFLQKATEDRANGGDLGKDTSRLFGLMIYAALPPVLILEYFGEELFRIVFGQGWAEGGVYVQILVFSFMGLFLYRVVSVFFDVFERQKQRLIFDIASLFLQTMALVVGVWIGGTPYVALAALALVTCVLYGMAYVYLFGLVGISGWQVMSLLSRKIVIMLPLIIGLALVKQFWRGDYWVASLTVAGLMVAQACLIVLADPWLKQKAQSSRYWR